MKEIIKNIQEKTPIIHCMTNYVTVNDVANVLLAYGASPIMADDIEEVEEITSICNGLYLNIGTLNERMIQSMLVAAKKAEAIHHPIVLDPVGAGASQRRTETARKILDEVAVSVVRGNLSEIKSLVLEDQKTSGVDANQTDRITMDTLDQVIPFAKKFAKEFSTVLAITGEIDLVTNGDTVYAISNGRKEMSKITGTGCQLTAMITAAVAANPEMPLEATFTSVCAMGIAGELAWKNRQPFDGNATYRNHIIDTIYHMTGAQLEREAKYVLR